MSGRATAQQRVLGLVDRTKESGKTEIFTGGDRNGDRGFFVEPTVVAGAPQEAEIIQKEVFALWSPWVAP